MAAFSRLFKFAIATINIFLVALFVVANKDFCGSVFETQVDHALVGHVMVKTDVADEFECQLKCMGNGSCKSFNVLQKEDINAKRRICELNNETRKTKPGDFKLKKNSAYYGSVQISCINVKRATSHPIFKSCKENNTNDKVNTEKQRKKVCGPVGVADTNTIPDARMTASTVYSNSYYPYYGRLNETRGSGAWCPKTNSDRTDYLQVDMGTVHYVCAVATQGANGASEWATSYKLHLSTNGTSWSAYKENDFEKVFPGNKDQHSIVKHSLSANVKARFVRFYPVTDNGWPSMRIEIFVVQ